MSIVAHGYGVAPATGATAVIVKNVDVTLSVSRNDVALDDRSNSLTLSGQNTVEMVDRTFDATIEDRPSIASTGGSTVLTPKPRKTIT